MPPTAAPTGTGPRTAAAAVSRARWPTTSIRRSRLRRLTRGIPNVGHRRVDDQLRLPHGLRVRRRVRAETGHSHQRQHHRLANRGDFQRRLIFRTSGE